MITKFDIPILDEDTSLEDKMSYVFKDVQIDLVPKKVIETIKYAIATSVVDVGIQLYTKLAKPNHTKSYDTVVNRVGCDFFEEQIMQVKTERSVLIEKTFPIILSHSKARRYGYYSPLIIVFGLKKMFSFFDTDYSVENLEIELIMLYRYLVTDEMGKKIFKEKFFMEKNPNRPYENSAWSNNYWEHLKEIEREKSRH